MTIKGGNMALDSIIDVSIVKGTRSISRAGFGVPLILGPNAVFTNEVRAYASLVEVAADFATSSDEYKMAAAILSQQPKIKKLKIAKTSTPVAQVVTLTPTVVNSAVYTVTIDGVVYSFTSDSNATAAEIVTGLTALIDADTNCPADASGSTTLVLTAKAAGHSFTVTQSANLAQVVTTANVGIATDILRYAELDADWYALLTVGADDLTIDEATKTIETMRKVYLARSSAAAIITNVSTDIVSRLKAKSFMRTQVFFNSVAAEYPDAAYLGAVLSFDPGSYTGEYKNLVGVTPAKLTSTQIGYLELKNASYYIELAGVSIVKNAKTVGGEWFDIVQFIDWLQARIQERLFGLLVNTKKIPYTDQGVAIVEAELRAQLQEGVRVGGLAADPAPSVEVPKVADVAPADRAARLLPDVAFQANLAGAIHAVEIQGVVQV